MTGIEYLKSTGVDLLTLEPLLFKRATILYTQIEAVKTGSCGREFAQEILGTHKVITHPLIGYKYLHIDARSMNSNYIEVLPRFIWINAGKNRFVGWRRTKQNEPRIANLNKLKKENLFFRNIIAGEVA